MSEQYLLLKWGTLKGWGGLGENPAAMDALKRYHEEPTALGAMQQRDTDTQQQAILDLIDAVEGDIINDWSGERLSKEEAKDYVKNYGRRG